MRRGYGHRGRGILTSFWTGLTMIVVAWWLLVGGAIVWVLPEQAPSAPSSGQRVRIEEPERQRWPIPTSRRAFDELQQAVADGDEARIMATFESAEWIEAKQGQTARIVTIDGDAVEIELLEGSYVGRHAWIARSLLTSP